MNTFTKNMNPSKKNMIAMAEHALSAVIGIMIILGQFSRSIDNEFWIYLVIFCSLFSPGFVFKSEEDKKRAGRISAIITIIATIASITLYAVFNGMWVFNAHCWYLFIGVAVASMSISMILMFLKSDRD